MKTFEYVRTFGDPESAISEEEAKDYCMKGMQLWQLQGWEASNDMVVPQSDCAMQHLSLNALLIGELRDAS